MTIQSKIFVLQLGLLCLFVVAGCFDHGPKTYFVEGVVTYNGAPVTNVVVGFSPIEGSQGIHAFGRTDANGKYVITSLEGGKFGKGAVPGKYHVSIRKEVLSREPTEKEVQLLREKGIPPEIPMKSLLPKHYGNPLTTDLNIEVVKSKNKFDFLLTD